MPFARFPFLLVVFFLVVTGGRIFPFVFVAFGIWIVLGIVAQAVRVQPRPRVTGTELSDLRADVAATLLDVDDDRRLTANREARARFESAGAYYASASAAMDHGVSRRDRDAVARALHRARHELDAAVAVLDGRPLPEPEQPRRNTRPAMTHRPRSQSWCRG